MPRFICLCVMGEVPFSWGAHCVLFEKWAILDPFSPMAKVTTLCSPYTGLLRFPLSPKTRIMS